MVCTKFWVVYGRPWSEICILHAFWHVLAKYYRHINDRISLRYNRKIHPVVFHNLVAVIGSKYVPINASSSMRVHALCTAHIAQRCARALAPHVVTHCALLAHNARCVFTKRTQWINQWNSKLMTKNIRYIRIWLNKIIHFCLILLWLTKHYVIDGIVYKLVEECQQYRCFILPGFESCVWLTFLF